MGLSKLTFYGGDIEDGSLATPGLWNRRFSALSQGLNQVNDDVASNFTVSPPAAGDSSSTTVGSLAYDANFLYAYVSDDSWRRVAWDGF